MNGTPVFKLMPFESVQSLPEAPAELFTVGVPVMGPKYNRGNELVVLDHPTAGTIMVFGAEPSGDPVGVELSSGHVVWTFGPQWNMPRLLTEPPGFINSDILCFNDCVRTAIARFPYYSRETELEERNAVADEIAAKLGAIDPPAMIIDRFWSTFIDDMKIGDFSTEDILGG